MSRSAIFNVLKIAFAAALIGYVVDKAGWENIRSSIANMDPAQWALGLGVILTGNVISMLRWQMLMRTVGLPTTTWDAVRLGFIGVFFNNVVPGLTGGDLVKAFYVARESPGMRADAVVTVIVDRIIGIVSLALIAAVVIPLDFAAYGEAAIGIYGFLAAAAIGGAAVLSRRIKARLKSLLPQGRSGKLSDALAKLDRAVSIYRTKLGVVCVAVLLSVVVHMCIIVGIWIFGNGIADGGLAAHAAGTADLEGPTIEQLTTLKDLDLTVYCSIIPIIMMISAVPIAPAGWGVGEAAFRYFFLLAGVAGALAVSLSLTFRVTSMLISLLGGVFLIFDRKRVMNELRSEDEDPTAHDPAAG